jgi:hypothetical protein
VEAHRDGLALVCTWTGWRLFDDRRRFAKAILWRVGARQGQRPYDIPVIGAAAVGALIIVLALTGLAVTFVCALQRRRPRSWHPRSSRRWHHDDRVACKRLTLELPRRSATGEPLDAARQTIACYWRRAHFGGRYLMFRCNQCHRPARVLYAAFAYLHHRISIFICRKCAGIAYQSTMGHRWDRSARRVEKLRARLQWTAADTVPVKPKGMHKKTYQCILGMLAYHEAVRKQGASYARKSRPDQHRAHLWRQCQNRFASLGGWPLR